MRATGDISGYFIDMSLHGFSVHPWRCDSRPHSARRTNRSEQIGVFLTLVGRLARPRPGSRPLTEVPVFWPILASSWNQISIGVVSGTPSRCALNAREKFF